MLYLDAPLELNGLYVYRDYSNKTRFYYLPKSPRLSMEGGQPMFQLLVYRDVSETATSAGGFLTMTTDLGVSSATITKTESELSGRFGMQATLAPVPVKGGSVRVTALDSGTVPGENGAEPRFVENLIAPGKPSLYGDQRAAFTAELSGKGAQLMKAAFEGDGATPVVLLYELQFVGLLPAYDVTIKIKFRQVYEHLRQRSQMNTLWFRSDIDREFESLIKSGAIDIEEVVYETESPEQTSARMTRLNTLAKELAQWSFFTPGLNPGAVLASDRGTLQAYDATTAVTGITAGLTSASRAALTGVGASADAGAPRRPGVGVATGAVEEAGSEGGTTEGGSAEGETTERGGDQPVPAAASGGPPTAVEAWNRAGRPQGAYLLRSLSQVEQQDIEYKLRQVSAVERSIAPQGQIRLLPGASSLPGRIVMADLDAEFFKTIEGTISTSADLAALGVASVQVKLRYGVKPDGSRWKDQVEKTLSATGQSHAYRFAVDDAGSSELEFQVILNYRPEASIGDETTKEESPWIRTTTRNFDINPAAYSSILPVELTAAMVDWNTVQQIQAKVSYNDPDSGLAAADTKILTRESPTAALKIRPKKAEKKQVTVRAAFFDAQGETDVVTIAQPGDEPFVINQPADKTAVVDIRLADELTRYEKVTVQLAKGAAASPQPERTLNLGEGLNEAQWSFRKATGGDARFSYKVTAFLKGGAIAEEPWKATDNPLLIVGDRIAGVLVVQVLFLSPPAEGGFRLVKLRLNYPDAPSWADSDIEQIFRLGTEELTWRVPMERADAKSYTYEVTWFGTDGSRRQTGPVTSSDEILLLDPLGP
ncbi:MAG: hypothetical protein AB7U75_22660 [Hyphomicrobiaceae bacterium]|nr:hypothetical protein [Nitrospirales bacterium]